MCALKKKWGYRYAIGQCFGKKLKAVLGVELIFSL